MFLGKTDFSSYLSLVSVYIDTSKLICLTIRLWIFLRFLSTDNLLTLVQYDTWGGSISSVTWLELKSEKCLTVVVMAVCYWGGIS